MGHLCAIIRIPCAGMVSLQTVGWYFEVPSCSGEQIGRVVCGAVSAFCSFIACLGVSESVVSSAVSAEVLRAEMAWSVFVFSSAGFVC